MNQLFPKKDQRRRWNGYWIYFYTDEYKPVGSKPLEKLHLHFIGQEGEIRVYLSQEKYLDIDEKWGVIPGEEQTEIKKFVKKNYQDIIARIEFYLTELGLKLK